MTMKPYALSTLMWKSISLLPSTTRKPDHRRVLTLASLWRSTPRRVFLMVRESVSMRRLQTRAERPHKLLKKRSMIQENIEFIGELEKFQPIGSEVVSRLGYQLEPKDDHELKPIINYYSIEHKIKQINQFFLEFV